ncbi:ATP-binding protein [Streptomyces sp. NPDC017979]|uniref:ATP-binding protein n=1 Tax=Streptomyces sp. NPDC017979 TaxID=3365024 RepID=UPI0037B8D25E
MTPALIGRAHPTRVLHTEIGRVTESHGGLVLVTGEAGIGKTSLVTDAADEARRRGALVLGGSCWDSDSAPGYWPWVQVMRGLRRAVGDAWPRIEKAADGRLGTLLGEAVARVPPGEAADAFPLYDAVTTALVTAAQQRPVVVVLDDLHWADPATLKLLEFIARHAWFERVLLIGTYRDAEVEAADHPLRPLLLPLVARATATVTLAGLDRADVGALIALFAGSEPEAALVDEVHRRSGGNPFFIEQTVRNWAGGSPFGTVAPGVREAVRRRLALLPATVVELLDVAAVLGREFHRQVLAAASGVPVAHADRLLERATAARLVTVGRAGRFAFVHDLVRETLYDELDEQQRHERHASVVRAVAGSSALRAKLLPADVARHAYLAGPELDRKARVDLLTAAAEDASGRLASEEAVAHYQRALEVTGDDDVQRATLIRLSLATEMHHHGDENGWRVYEEAIAHARRVRDPELLARVAITIHQNDFTAGGAFGTGPRSVELLREAHRALIGDGGEPVARLSVEEVAQDLAVRITALARRADDDDTLGFSLWARHDSIWGLGTARERLALTDEMAAVARRTHNREMEMHATSMRWVTLLELGDPGYFEQLRAFNGLVGRLGQRRFELSRAIDNSLVSAFTGRFTDAVDLLSAAGVLKREHPTFGYVTSHMQWSLFLLQGRYEEARILLAEMNDLGHPYPQIGIGITAVETGDTALALRMHEELAALSEPVPRLFAPIQMRLHAQVAAASGDPARVEEARAALAPHAGEWIVSLYGCDLSGPVDLWRGLLEAARGDRAAAVAALTSAAESADRMRARPWALRSRAALLDVLGQDAPADLVATVHRDAEELQMTHLLQPHHPTPVATSAPVPVPAPEPALEERPHAATSDTSPTAAGPSAGPTAQFHREGAVWALVFEGRVAHMPDAKGLRDLHALLTHAGDDLSAVQLLAPEGGAEVIAARGLGGDPVLDEEAKASYRRRLERLDEEIDRAAELGDERRATEYSRERDALLDELRTAAGLGGRTRRLGDEAERARKTVTARIRDALRRMQQLHPELAAHLKESVTTGAHCSYRPARAVDWRL